MCYLHRSFVVLLSFFYGIEISNNPRSNINTSSPCQYYRIPIFNPYLKSIFVSLKSQFGTTQEIPFKWSILQPYLMKNVKKYTFVKKNPTSWRLYGIDNLTVEACVWYDIWVDSYCTEKVGIFDNFQETHLYSAVQKMLILYKTIPPTTYTVKRTFSSLWLGCGVLWENTHFQA